MGIASKSDLSRLSYTVRPPAKEISRSREAPPKNIPTFIYRGNAKKHYRPIVRVSKIRYVNVISYPKVVLQIHESFHSERNSQLDKLQNTAAHHGNLDTLYISQE